MYIKKGDTVEVVTGKYKGKRGKVIEVILEKDQVRVEGVQVIKRHYKPSKAHPEGGIVEKFGTIHVSNVMLLDPKENKPTRVGFKLLDNGRKVRISKRSGELLDK